MILLLVASVCGMSSPASEYREHALAQDVAFELRTDRDSYVVGEPVEFRLTARNTSATPLRVRSLVHPLSLRLEIWSKHSGSDHRVDFHGEGPRRMEGLEPHQTLAPNQIVSESEMFSVDRGRNAFILDKAGTYEFRAIFCDVPGDPNSRLESTAWTVQVDPPSDAERDAFEAYKRVNAAFSEWPPRLASAVTRDDALVAFDFVERFPLSPWAGPVKKGLVSAESHRGSERKANPEEDRRFKLLLEREPALLHTP
jgi:hypothetical protein